MFQNLISQVSEIVGSEFGIMDETGMITTCSNEKRIGQVNPLISQIVKAKEQFVTFEGVTYHKVYSRNKIDFITFIEAEGGESMKVLSLISINASSLKAFYDEKFDKVNFVKSILLDNNPSGDVSFRAKELHISYNAFRAVLLIRTEKTRDFYVHEIIQELFPNRTKDFVVVLDDVNTVLVKELKTDEDCKEIEKTAKTIIDTLGAESMVKAFIGVGTIVDNLGALGRSFKEAQAALRIGRIFETDKSIVYYNSLGLGRLIYQLPTDLCRLFLDEVFKEGSFDSLDNETIHTILKFFENNLNVSESSRQLYVHRNTLVYRLDKIQKLTGLDIRNFDDAIIFKVAMLVKRYLDRGGKE